MAFQFRQHYSREEARALLPRIRQWLQRMTRLREQLREAETQFAQRLAEGWDLGGEPTHRWLRRLADLQTVVGEFQSREIQIKDLDRGLVDFPALREGKEVFLCWEQDEEDIEFWHDLDAGYAGRERL